MDVDEAFNRELFQEIEGRAGLLDSLTATTFHSSIESLRKALPATRVLSDVRFVDNGTVIAYMEYDK